MQSFKFIRNSLLPLESCLLKYSIGCLFVYKRGFLYFFYPIFFIRFSWFYKGLMQSLIRRLLFLFIHFFFLGACSFNLMWNCDQNHQMSYNNYKSSCEKRENYIIYGSGETRKNFHKSICLLSFLHMFSLKKHFVMYLINNKNYLCKKFIRRKKQVAKQEFIVLNVFCERVEILRMLHTNNTVKPV